MSAIDAATWATTFTVATGTPVEALDGGGVAVRDGQGGVHKYDSTEDTNNTFKIRFLEYDEKLAFPPLGIYCTFEAAGPGSSEWREIMTSRTKSGIYPREHVKFLAENIAYIFLTDKFAITIDGGGAWTVWEGEKALPDVNLHYRRPRIRTVTISPDGHGEMVVFEAGVSVAQFSEARD